MSLTRPYLVIILAVVLLLVVGIYLFISNLSVDQDNILYGLIYLYRSTSAELLLVAIALLIVWLLSLFRSIGKMNRRKTLIAFVAGLLLAASLLGSLHLTVNAGLGMGFEHLAQAPYENHLYQLAFMRFPQVDSPNNEPLVPVYVEASYNLYRCDSVGYSCERIYQLDASSTSDNSRLNPNEVARTAALVNDPNAGTISIQVNGETIHTLSI